MQVKRSGEAVRGAVLTGSVSVTALTPLLEPWVTKALNDVAGYFHVTLAPGYHAQFLMALSGVILWAVAHMKVRAIEQASTQQDPPTLSNGLIIEGR